MSDPTIIKPDRETKEDTKAGNYFIANYPPFSFLNEKDIPMVGSLLNSPKTREGTIRVVLPCAFLQEALPFLLFPCLHR